MRSENTIQLVMRAHLNRAIVVRLREDLGTLKSRVFSRTRWMPVGHHREVCCEEIEISVSMNRLADIPGIVSLLAAPDVPRVVWFSIVPVRERSGYRRPAGPRG